MKIPKYILDKIYRRAKAGNELNTLDVEIHEWMKKKGIEDISSFLSGDSFDYIIQNSIMLINEPETLRDLTIEYIERAGNSNDSKR